MQQILHNKYISTRQQHINMWKDNGVIKRILKNSYIKDFDFLRSANATTKMCKVTLVAINHISM
jgi:hypothetical protein